MAADIFTQPRYIFPYEYSFPGQASDETLLYVTRENTAVLMFKRVAIVLTALIIAGLGWGLGSVIRPFGGAGLAVGVQVSAVALALVFAVIGWWWVTTLWKKSIAIVTTKRLTKFIYTTPVNRHNLSLPLEMIVDTGSYTKGFIQAALNLGTFTARSSASSSGVATDDPARVNKKYFYIENVSAAEDLQHYVAKLLTHFRKRPEKLATFRPFIPHLKGDARREFMKDHPEYWS